MTLVELLIAASVLAMALLALAGMFPSAYQNVKYGGQITRATALAQEMMEILRNESFATLASYNGLNTSACGFGTDSIATNCRKWRDDINAVGLPSGWGSIAVVSAASDLLTVTVTVGWTERIGARTVQLVTYAVQY